MKHNDANVAFHDVRSQRFCPADVQCCVTFKAKRCCNRHGRHYAITDGACGNSHLCSPTDDSARAEACRAYGADDCRASICTADLCNDIT